MACATVLSVSCASRGSTSIETRPSIAVGRLPLRLQHVSSVADVVGGDGADGGVHVGATLGQLGDLGVVGVAVGDSAFWKIDGLVVTPTTLLVSISSCRLPDLQAVPRQVVQPDGYALRRSDAARLAILSHRITLS